MPFFIFGLEYTVAMKYLAPLLLIILLFPSCAKRKAEKQAEEDDQIIQQYIIDNNLTATKSESGLYVVIEDPGSGAACSGFSDVTVAYTGYFTSGSVFDQSDAQGITFNLSGVIQGWHEGIPYFREGGSGKLLIPSAQGYGPNGSGSIPPNSVLIFDVDLIDVL